VNLYETYGAGLRYADFLERYANEGQKQRWRQMHEQVSLNAAQREVLASFRRSMHVLCLAGAWCGDCINQCPIFEHFAALAPVIDVRYLDRDDNPDVQRELQINGGNRVPVVVFFSEDGQEACRYGERTISKYRQMACDQVGDMCSTGIAIPGDSLLARVTEDWLNEFERVQWMLRLSPRLRQIHKD